MIASLRGTLQEKSLRRLVIDVNGVGYLVHVSMQTLAELPDPGSSVFLICHTHVREDAFQIFGFLSVEELEAFELLIGVSGIGPKAALTMLSGMPVRELLGAIARGDHKRLQSLPGVGKKTAERVVVDLKDKCTKLNLTISEDGQAAPKTGEAVEVVDALTNLGYKRPMAEKAVRRVLQEASGSLLSPEQLLRAALTSITEV